MAFIGRKPTPSALTSSDIADDIITEAKMANDAISLTELKAGTDGELITWDASGNPVAVAVGSSGQFLKSQGAGSVPVFADAAGGTTPAFLATQANTGFSAQNFSKIQFADEKLDTDNCYDPSTNFRFTPSTAGWYYIFARVAFDNDSASSRHVAILQKNGTEVARGDMQFTGNYFTNNNTSMQVDYIIQFNGSSDYVETSGYSEQNGSTKNTDGYGCFGGFLIKAT